MTIYILIDTWENGLYIYIYMNIFSEKSHSGAHINFAFDNYYISSFNIFLQKALTGKIQISQSHATSYHHSWTREVRHLLPNQGEKSRFNWRRTMAWSMNTTVCLLLGSPVTTILWISISLSWIFLSILCIDG